MMLRTLSAIGLVLVAALARGTAVAGQDPRPATTRPLLEQAAPGEFVWHDLVTGNPAACRAFYGALFGWTFEAGDGIDPGYTIIKHEGQPIGGIALARDREAAVAQWIAYVAVPDVDSTADAFRQAGGRVFRGPLTARDDLRVAIVADPQGAPLGLASRGPRLENGAPAPPALHRWLWMEYVATDADAALAFYADAVGFRHEVHESRDDGFVYHLLATDRPRAGLFLSPWERETSAWLPYVRVEDPAAMAARAVKLGGAVVLEPGPRVRNGSLAIILDPTGAPLALQKYPFDTGATR